MRVLLATITCICIATLAHGQEQVRYEMLDQYKELQEEADDQERPELELGVAYSFPTKIEDTAGAELSAYSVGLSASVGFFYASYVHTRLGWERPQLVPFGDGVHKPIEEVHLLDVAITHEGELDKDWEYGIYLGTWSAFEEEMSNAFAYYLSIITSFHMEDDWVLYLGVSVDYNHMFDEVEVYPLTGGSWREDAEDGFSLHIGIPDTSVTYHFTPHDSMTLQWDTDGFFARLTDDTTIANASYLEAERDGVGLMYSTELSDTLSLDMGLSYLFDGEIITRDSEGDKTSSLDLEDGLALNFVVSCTF